MLCIFNKYNIKKFSSQTSSSYPTFPTNDNWIFKTNFVECNELSYPERERTQKNPKNCQERQHPSSSMGSLSLSLPLSSPALIFCLAVCLNSFAVLLIGKNTLEKKDERKKKEKKYEHTQKEKPEKRKHKRKSRRRWLKRN